MSQQVARRSSVIRVVAFIIGYVLSPLSFWNDAVVNIPIAYVIAYLASLVLGKGIFPLVFFLAYNATNILGFVLMHLSVRGSRKYTLKSFVEAVAASIVYTLVATTVFQLLGA